MPRPWLRRRRTDHPRPRITLDDAELRERLSDEEYRVTQRAGTERPFTGRYWDASAAGTYHCIVCDEPLFDSTTKYDSGTGWPSFFGPVDDAAVARSSDRKMIIRRTEARCATCGAHLGHIFADGPAPTGERYCMNSAALRLAPDEAG